MELKVINCAEVEKEELAKTGKKELPDDFFIQYLNRIEVGTYLFIGSRNYSLISKTQSPTEDLGHPNFSTEPHYNYTRITIPKTLLLLDQPVSFNMAVETYCSCQTRKPRLEVAYLGEMQYDEDGEDEKEEEVVKN